MDFLDEDVQRTESYRTAVGSNAITPKITLGGVTQGSSSTDVLDTDKVAAPAPSKPVTQPSTASVQVHSPATKPAAKPTPARTPAAAKKPQADDKKGKDKKAKDKEKLDDLKKELTLDEHIILVEEF
jgi:hypothetical protein